MYKRIWTFACVALLLSMLFLHLNLISDRLSLTRHSSATLLQEDWQWSSDAAPDEKQDEPPILAFSQLGNIRDQHQWTITHTLPATSQDSLVFVTIGYQVAASVDGNSIYHFGESPSGKDVWGVKTHLIPLPDGNAPRTLSLVFATEDPSNVALSSYILMDHDANILSTLLKSNSIKILFPLLYVSMGLFLLILALLRLLLRKADGAILILGLAAVGLGFRILLNNSLIAFFTGPVTAYWSIQLLNLSLPILILLMASTELDHGHRRYLRALSALQGVLLLLWIVLNLLETNLVMGVRLLNWNAFFFLLMAASLTVVLAREWRQGRRHAELTVSLLFFLVAVSLNAFLYYRYGIQNTMDLSLTMLTFPLLVLMTGKAIFDSVNREEGILLENRSLKQEGDLLLKNYSRVEHYIEETRKIWHDIDKHLSVMNRLEQEGEREELQDYLHRVGNDAASVKRSYLSDNTLLNAIFTDKLQEAEANGIQCQVSIQVPKKLQIPGSDLCSLLVNLMDNALEACIRMPEESHRFIHARVHWKNEFLYIGIENSCIEGSSPSEQSMLVSGKVRRQHLGVGLEITANIVKQYDGILEINHADSTFQVQAVIRDPMASHSPNPRESLS